MRGAAVKVDAECSAARAGSAAAVESGGCAGRAQDARISVRILPLVGDWQTRVGLAMSVAQVLFCVVLARSAGGRWWSVVCVCVYELGRRS